MSVIIVITPPKKNDVVELGDDNTLSIKVIVPDGNTSTIAAALRTAADHLDSSDAPG